MADGLGFFQAKFEAVHWRHCAVRQEKIRQRVRRHCNPEMSCETA
jgi:hypothetical protein